MCCVEESMPDVSLYVDFFHSFPRMLEFLSFSFTFSIAAITLGLLAFTSALLGASLAR